MKRPKLKPNSGVALLLVMVALALIMVISVEIIFTARVELRIGRNARDRLQAEYLARSASKFGLLRLYMFREIYNLKVAGTIPKEAISDDLLDKIWSAPFPAFPFPGSKSEWPGTMSLTIQTEGSKIPINMLDANIYRKSDKSKATQVKDEITKLFKSLMEDEEFARQYRDTNFDELVDNLQDWIDRDSDKQKGGDENSDYDKVDPPIHPRNDRITSLEELHLVAGWTDDLVKRLSPNFSAINTSLKVNPNYIPLSRIKGFWPKLTTEDLQVIQRKRLEKPFPDLKSLEQFIDTSPDIKNGRGFVFPEGMELSSSQRIFYVNASGVVGDALKNVKIGIRIDDEVPPKKNADGSTPTGTDAAASGTDTSTPGSSTSGGTSTKGPAKMAEPSVISIEETT